VNQATFRDGVPGIFALSAAERRWPFPVSWLPFSIAEAALSAESGGADLDQAWSHLLSRLREAAQIVESDPANHNRVDLAAGIRHLLVLLAAGIDEVLRFDPHPMLRVQRTSTDDIVSWGMECPDCLYTRAVLRGGRVVAVKVQRPDGSTATVQVQLGQLPGM